jgi:signal transduction histidine kinase
MASLPLVLVAPPGPDRDQFLTSLPGDPPELFDSVEGFQGREGEDWGIVILGPGLPPGESLAFLAGQAFEEAPWSALMAWEEEGVYSLRPLAMGRPTPQEKVQEVRMEPEENGPILELHWVLRVVARARHDLNNPLTSGLAEAQLLLMDEHPPEVKDSVETIQEQYRRLRDMVADLSRLRAPKGEPPLPF